MTALLRRTTHWTIRFIRRHNLDRWQDWALFLGVAAIVVGLIYACYFVQCKLSQAQDRAIAAQKKALELDQKILDADDAMIEQQRQNIAATDAINADQAKEIKALRDIVDRQTEHIER